MSGFLLDVNVVISLIDPTHVHHDRAHRWFAKQAIDEWLSCPITQNGAVRIIGNPKYANRQPVGTAMDSVRSLCDVGAHRFVADTLSIFGPGFDQNRMLSSSQITDTYLLALAVSEHALLATFDTRITTSAVDGGAAGVFHIP